eukprot:1054123_1
MWYIQINNNYPQKMNSSWIAFTKNSKVTKWYLQIPNAEKVDIIYVFNQYNVVKGSYRIQIKIGGLPEFHLGVINNNNPALQTEPNFPIQRGTKCFVTVQQQQMPQRTVKATAYTPKQNTAVVDDFNKKFDQFFDALSCEWSQVFMTDLQTMITNDELDRNRPINK